MFRFIILICVFITPYTFASKVGLPVTSSTQESDWGNVFIGTMYHSLNVRTLNDQRDYVYRGLNLAVQLDIHKHWGLYAGLNAGELNKIQVDNNTSIKTYSGSQAPNDTYINTQLGLILSTNLDRGWQFFTGLAAFSERYSESFGSTRISGIACHFGSGYSWEEFQVTARYSGLNSSEYPDDFGSEVWNLQLGINF